MRIHPFKNKITTFSIFLVSAFLFFITTSAKVSVGKEAARRDAHSCWLPNVFNENHGDIVESKLRHEAVLKYSLYQLPTTKKGWDIYKAHLRNEIIKKTAALVNQKLPLNLQETASSKMKGYTIKNITFQTRLGIYATANLYIPDGAGKFPGVIVMMGHSVNGRFYNNYQSVGISLALNGYVSLCIDPWGSGERTTTHGEFEDHGDENNLGAQLMNVGETLMGMLLTDNIRGVDLLCSLPYVDSKNIGATGSSGGGNQTMWLTAMDERIKAAVPVVSVGTFESYIMGTPCICEVLIDGLTFTEEAGVLGMIAPRAIKMCNHSKDANGAFNPREMIRSYKNARPIFDMLGVGNNIAFDTFNLAHGYWPEDRRAMLGWFNLHLKGSGNGDPVQEAEFKTLPYEQLMTYSKGKRDSWVMSTEEYCKQKGNELRSRHLSTKSLNAAAKRNELRNILRANEKSVVRNVHEYAEINGWKRFALETFDNKVIPVLLRSPAPNAKEFVIVSDPAGKENISTGLIDGLINSGLGIAIVDLSGTGETSSAALYSNDTVGRFRTLTKSSLLLGKTVLGEWVKELDVVRQFITSKFKIAKVSINGSKEAGLAGLYLAALEGNIEKVTLQNAPVSYGFDNRDNIEFFSTGIHVLGFLNWGNVSLASALTPSNITFINPVTMSGQKLSVEKLKAYKAEFEQMRRMTKQAGATFFK